jgi:hypothetical protein
MSLSYPMLLLNIDKSYLIILLVCPIGTFKSTISNEHRCEQCPLNSHTKDKGSSLCICNEGFFRLNSSCIGK